MAITLEFPEELQRKIANHAARLNMSPTELVMSAVTQLLEQDDAGRKSAIKKAAMESIEKNREMLEKLS